MSSGTGRPPMRRNVRKPNAGGSFRLEIGKAVAGVAQSDRSIHPDWWGDPSTLRDFGGRSRLASPVGSGSRLAHRLSIIACRDGLPCRGGRNALQCGLVARRSSGHLRVARTGWSRRCLRSAKPKSITSSRDKAVDLDLTQVWLAEVGRRGTRVGATHGLWVRTRTSKSTVVQRTRSPNTLPSSTGFVDRVCMSMELVGVRSSQLWTSAGLDAEE